MVFLPLCQCGAWNVLARLGAVSTTLFLRGPAKPPGTARQQAARDPPASAQLEGGVSLLCLAAYGFLSSPLGNGPQSLGGALALWIQAREGQYAVAILRFGPCDLSTPKDGNTYLPHCLCGIQKVKYQEKTSNK